MTGRVAGQGQCDRSGAAGKMTDLLGNASLKLHNIFPGFMHTNWRSAPESTTEGFQACFLLREAVCILFYNLRHRQAAVFSETRITLVYFQGVLSIPFT